VNYSYQVITVRQTEFFRVWLAMLRDKHGAAIIRRRITRLELGNFGDTKTVGDGVSELRIDFGPGYRLYFTRRERELVILLCGGDKGSQARDIARAKQMAKEF
jgi:putative addiction module killer protein